jgi:hypothetical protein
MNNASLPRDYQNWRADTSERAGDAGYLFGYYLIMHCRDKAMATVPSDASPTLKTAVEKAVDVALHNLCDMLEGFWPLEAGANTRVSLALSVQVRDAENAVMETVEISPCLLDLPIGYWKWARDREFR